MARAILDGARFGSGDQAMAFARERVIDAHEVRGHVCRITHSQDGVHSDGSLHYINHAEDYGFVDIPEETRQAIYRDVREALNADDPYADFDVIYGDRDHKQHMHLEFQPKRAMNK
jgi:hypothetical protein